ncbi:MAG: hypothetical protein E7099_08535 [Mediterranea massiliensis]|nr:hypothetical protein [Mediterranea massiliensis]
MTNKTSRTKNASLNTMWAMISQGVIVLLGLFSRKIFLDHLGAELLGVNSLFTDVLLLFSFADLGFGTAIMFSMYHPIAQNNTNKIQSLLVFYREVYNYVIVALLVISLLFIPFLFTINSTISIGNLLIYYLFFQANNIIQYVWAYRESYVVATQNERVLTKINMFFSVSTTLLLIIAVILYSNYLFYLILTLLLCIVKKLWINAYIKRRYPITIIDNVENITKHEKEGIIKKSVALLITKVGNLLINQTDSLVVSTMINVTQWGFASNYIVIKKSIFTITDKIYSGLLPSMGNLVVSNDKKRELSVFLKYDFLNAWMHTFCFVAFTTLSTPFIALFFGSNVVLPDSFVFFFFLAAFVDGLRSPVSVLREASGTYEVDKWYTIIAAIVNLLVSLPLAHYIGLEGVFLGTICAMLVLHISRTIILLRNNNYNITPMQYLWLITKHIVLGIIFLFITYIIILMISSHIDNEYVSFFISGLLVIIIPNILWITIYCKNENLIQLFQIIKLKINE